MVQTTLRRHLDVDHLAEAAPGGGVSPAELWRATVRVVVAPALPDLRPDELPTDPAGLERFGAALATAGTAPDGSAALALEHAHAVIGAAALHAGWAVVAGSPPQFRRGGRRADLFAAYAATLDGRAAEAAWPVTCHRLGLVAPAATCAGTDPGALCGPAIDDNRQVARRSTGCTLPAAPAALAAPPAGRRRPLAYRARLRQAGIAGGNRTLVVHGDVVSWGTDWVRATDVVSVAYGHRRGARPAVHVAVATATTHLRLQLRSHGRDAQATLEAYAALRRWSAEVVEPMLVAGHLRTVATFGRAEIAGTLVDAAGIVVGGVTVPWPEVAGVDHAGDAVVISRRDPADGVVAVARLSASVADAVLLPAVARRLTAAADGDAPA